MSKTVQYMTMLKDRLERNLDYNIRQVQQLPKGTLITNESKGLKYLYWSRTSDTNPEKRDRTPLNESDRKLIEQLRLQRIMRLQIPLFRHNIKAITRFLKSYKPCDESTCLRSLKPAYSENLNYQGFEPPQKNPSYPEYLVHTNSIGEVLRSRIEVQISELLLSKNIKYDYDVALQLGNKTRYPDFRITHPKTGEFIYFEYFGKMYEDEYAQENLTKIQDYLKAGYVYGKNLMFFFENASGIDITALSRTIDMLTQ